MLTRNSCRNNEVAKPQREQSEEASRVLMPAVTRHEIQFKSSFGCQGCQLLRGSSRNRVFDLNYAAAVPERLSVWIFYYLEICYHGSRQSENGLGGHGLLVESIACSAELQKSTSSGSRFNWPSYRLSVGTYTYVYMYIRYLIYMMNIYMYIYVHIYIYEYMSSPDPPQPIIGSTIPNLNPARTPLRVMGIRPAGVLAPWRAFFRNYMQAPFMNPERSYSRHPIASFAKKSKDYKRCHNNRVLHRNPQCLSSHLNLHRYITPHAICHRRTATMFSLASLNSRMGQNFAQALPTKHATGVPTQLRCLWADFGVPGVCGLEPA